MFLIEYDQPDGSKLLVEVHADRAPAGAHLRQFEGETAVGSDIDLLNSISPIMTFCRTLMEQACAISSDAELRIGVNFTGRGHAYVAQSDAVLTLTMRSDGSF